MVTIVSTRFKIAVNAMQRKVHRPALIVYIIAILLAAACRKESGSHHHPPDPQLHLLHTGYYWDPTTQLYNASYWLDSNIHLLPVKAGASAYAYGIDTKGSDIYIAGMYDADDRVRLLPTYWKNGVQVTLPYSAFEPFEKCIAKDILAWKGRLYILGAVDLRPVIWIVNEDGSVSQKFIDDHEGVRSASRFALANDQLYVGGDKAYSAGAGYKFDVGYWTIDRNGAQTWHQIETDLKYATAFSITVGSGKVFIAGERNTVNSRSTDSYMNLWSSSGKVDLHPVDEPAGYRLNEIEPMENGQILLTVYDFITHRPLIFKIDQSGTILQKIRPVIPEGLRGYCTSIAYSNGHLAYSGFYTTANYPQLWVIADENSYALKLPYPTQAVASTAKWISK
jgi:hypothetical protein